LPIVGGTLRERRPKDTLLFLTNFDNEVLQIQTDDGPQTVSVHGETVFEFTYADTDPASSLRDHGITVPGSALSQKFDAIALGALLGVDRQLVPSASTAQAVLRPFHETADFRPSQNPPIYIMSVTTLTSEESAEVARYAKLIEQGRTEKIELGLQRTLSGVLRREGADGLLDLFMAWENFFGSGRVQVSTALAWLLEPESPKARQFLQVQAAKLFNLRNDIAHGTTPKTKDLQADYMSVRDLTLRVVRTLFEARPDLISQGTNRGVALMLGL
jgi:hypothetical protein